MARSIPCQQLWARIWLICKRRINVPLRHFWPSAGVTKLPVNHDLDLSNIRSCAHDATPQVTYQNHMVVFEILGKKGTFSNLATWPWSPAESMFSHLWLIHLHSMEYLKATDDELFIRIIKDWIAANPKHHQGYWYASWNAYALSVRTFVWMIEYWRRPGLRDQVGPLMVESLISQIEFLSHNLETDLGGNHLIKNIRALLLAGKFFKGQKSCHWTKRGLALLDQEVHRQVLDDGMHFERSPSYHNDVLQDLMNCYAMVTDDDTRDLLKKTIEKMSKVAASLTHPDGHVALFNDSVVSSVSTSDLKDELDMLGIRAPVESNEFSFPESGFSGRRWGQNYFVVKHGLMGAVQQPGHGHADIFSFEWSLEGHRFIVDKGVFEYEAGNQRDLSRATQSHNTLNIDGRDQCEMWGSFRSGRKPRVTSAVEFNGDEIVVEGSHDGYCRLAGRPVHKRWIAASERHISVEDKVIGGCGQIAEARLLLHPDCKPIKRGGTILIGFDRYQVELTSNSDMKITEAKWFPTFGESIKTHQIALAYGPIPGAWNFKLSRLK